MTQLEQQIIKVNDQCTKQAQLAKELKYELELIELQKQEEEDSWYNH